MSDCEGIEISIDGGLAKLMEERQISLEDVKRTILHAQAAGSRFVNGSTGRSLGTKKSGHVTFWVEYSLEEGVYILHSAYSHRMEMRREGIP